MPPRDDNGGKQGGKTSDVVEEENHDGVGRFVGQEGASRTGT